MLNSFNIYLSLLSLLIIIDLGHKFMTSDIARHAITPSESSLWLSDASVTGYFTMLRLIDSRMYDIQKDHVRSLFLTSIDAQILFENINRRDWRTIEKCLTGFAARSYLDQNNVFFAGKMFIPLNTPGHWTLAVIFFKEKSIVYYDSFNKTPKDGLLNPKRLLDMLEQYASENVYPTTFVRSQWRFTTADCVHQVHKIYF